MHASRVARIEPTKALYQVLRRLSEELGQDFDTLWCEAQDAPLPAALDRYHNISHGRLDKVKARNIHEWLARNHFAFAQKHAPELFQEPRISDWDQLLLDHPSSAGLRAVAAEGFGIARRQPPEDGIASFRIGQGYLFELTLAQPGYAVAFEEYNGIWYPLPLGQEERNLVVRVADGPNPLPRGDTGQPIPLYEYDHAGPHRFVFVVRHGQRPPVDRPSLVKLAKQEELLIRQLRLRIIS